TLLLLLVPWLILEPVKPRGLLLFARKHHFAATLVIIGGEIIKLTLFEQLFNMTRPKLLTFSWFARCYGKWRAALVYVESLRVWHTVHGWYRSARAWIKRQRTALR